MLQSFLCVSRALVISQALMIRSDLQPPPTVQSARSAPGEADLHLKTGCWRAFVPLCVRACPRTLAQIADAAFPARKESGGRQEGVGGDEGIKILDEEPGVLPAQSAHLLSLGRLELPGTPRYTHRQAATPWHHHTLRCAITAGVFPDLVFVAI